MQIQKQGKSYLVLFNVQPKCGAMIHVERYDQAALDTESDVAVMGGQQCGQGGLKIGEIHPHPRDWAFATAFGDEAFRSLVRHVLGTIDEDIEDEAEDVIDRLFEQVSEEFPTKFDPRLN